MKTLALLTGSMDPFTRGHKHIVDMSLVLFDKLVVGIGVNPEKPDSGLFSMSQKVEIVTGCLAEYGDRVSVEPYTGVTIDLAGKLGATVMVRGIRDGTDHAYESSMTWVNSLMGERELGRVIPTVYFQCPPGLTEVSSSRVRELVARRRSLEVLSEYLLPPALELIEHEIYRPVD